MKILPVLDLRGGVVVRGVAGRREEYRPIVSRWCADPSPGSVARGLREAFGFDECYVADLDAIAGGEPSRSAYDAIDRAGYSQWIDAGRACFTNLTEPLYVGIRTTQFARPIAGLECLESEADCFVARMVDRRVVFSLDVMLGRPITVVPEWIDFSAEEIADHVVTLGIRTVIVLDLAGVGMGQGVPTLDLCRRLRAKYPKLELVSGGGVRGLDDLKALRDAGCDAALVSSALHDGRLTPHDPLF